MLEVLSKKNLKKFTIDNINHVLHDMGVVQKNVNSLGTQSKRLYIVLRKILGSENIEPQVNKE